MKLLAVVAVLSCCGSLQLVGTTAAYAQTTASTIPGLPATTTTTSSPSTTSTTIPGKVSGGGGGSGSGSGSGSPPQSAPGATGVPSVPVGGPPSTAAPPGTPPPPPPDPTPILAAVHADLTQLTAIDDYAPARADVASRQAAVTAAQADLQSAQAVLAADVKGQQDAAARVGDASQRLERLAIAAYMGLGYATPAGASGGKANLSTVSTPGGLSGTDALDAEEMLRLASARVRSQVTNSRHLLEAAQAVTARANAAVQQANGAVATAQNALLVSQQMLSLVTKVATVPGAAAQIDLLSLPGGAAATEAPATTVPGSPPTDAATQPATTAGPPKAAGTVVAAASLPPPKSPSILGPSMLTAPELVSWFNSTNHKPNTTVPIDQLAGDYQQAGQATGVRFDLAFAQSVVETGFFSFPTNGQLTPADNNFAGIGACDSCAHGWSFPDALTGVTAQLELLEAYASPTKVPTPLIGPVGVGGCCATWMALAGKWASSLQYGISIMTIYHQMLTWVIPQRLSAAGVSVAPTSVVAQGPSLAPLPGR